jgi:hypothetical protein
MAFTFAGQASPDAHKGLFRLYGRGFDAVGDS